MCCSRAAAALALVAMLALAGCGPLPHPFAPDARRPARTDPLRPVADIVVATPHDAALAEAVAEALRGLEVVASGGGGNRGSLRLTAAITAAPDADTAVLRWALRDAGGMLVGGFEQRADAAALGSGESDRLGPVADAAAMGVLALLGAAADELVAPRRLFVPPVIGAPGDGATSLRRAMARALAGAGVALARELGDETLLVLGSVFVDDAAPDTQRVEVSWDVLAPDGQRIGVIAQANTVPGGTLDGPWGAVAAVIAAGGAEGVLELLDRTGRR